MAAINPKKDGQSKTKPESLLSLISALAQFILLVAGIVGITTTVFREGGLAAQFGDYVLEAESYSGMVIMAILAALAIFFGRAWYARTYGKNPSVAIATGLMYVVMGIGAFVLYRYFFS